MEKENIELLDVSYDNAKSESNPRQIRTKKASFTSINDKFNAFRIRLLNKKLEEEKDKALKQEYVANADGEITAETEDKMFTVFFRFGLSESLTFPVQFHRFSSKAPHL